jgi:hypothetical protein
MLRADWEAVTPMTGPGLAPALAGLLPVDAGVMGAGAGVARFLLEVGKAGVDGAPDHRVDFGQQAAPVLVAFVVPGLAGQAGVLAEGGVEDRDRLRQRQGQVEVQGALPGLPRGFQAEFSLAFRGGVRFGGQRP